LALVLNGDDEALQMKGRMLECFVSQRETLATMATATPECFRDAPEYDFRRPPHAPPLLYDLYRWGITSDQWLARAAALLDGESVSCP
jgi:hypothetical protein